jgi:rare lipoprotein A
MRNIVFCAICLGLGCDASAAEMGLASFYRDPLVGGMTAAHRSLPLGSEVKVVNLDNGRAVVVRIVDRGPFIRGRIIDVSPAAAVTLGFREAGLAHVKIDLISRETPEGGRLPEQQAAPARYETSAYEICRYGSVRLERLQGDSFDEATLSHSETGCENLRSRFFPVAQGPDDLPPLLARISVHLVGVEAAGSIPVSALAGLDAASGIPVSDLAEIDAAASILVTALPPAPAKHEAFLTRHAAGCGATAPCEKQKPSPSNPVVVLLARLRHIFD